MKNRLIIFGMVALAMVACSKKNPAPNADNTKADTIVPDTTVCEFIPNAVTDIDGNAYNAVKIGEQLWMAENLRVTKDRDGKEIALNSKASPSTPYRYCPDGNQKNVEKYGCLYNWEAAKRVCPKGWHLPSDEEWKQLEMAAGMSQEDADKAGRRGDIAAKLCGDEGWNPSSEAAAAGNKSASGRNATGFSALPAGDPHIGLNRIAYFWCATEHSSMNAYSRCLSFSSAGIERGQKYKDSFFSVRCVRDPLTPVEEVKEIEQVEEVEKENISLPAGYVDLGLSVYWKTSNEWNNSDDHGFYTYDEAKSKFGSKLPTKEQYKELLNKCTWTWTGSGYNVRGANGNKIVLPAAGIRLCDNGGVNKVGNFGSYWSSTPLGSEFAWNLSFGVSGHAIYGYNRCNGQSVRLVQSK